MTTTDTDSQTLQQFIESAGVTMTVAPRDSNPHMDDMPNASHWTCTLRSGRSRMSIPFSQGSAHTQPPTVADVLDCLASDASGLSNSRSFNDWCAEYGYDTDSRKAEKTYKAVVRQSAKLNNLLGDSGYETLLYKTLRD